MGFLLGGFSLSSVGSLFSVTGIIIAIQGIEAAGAFSGPAMAPGVKMSLLSMSFGTLILGIAVLLWYILQLRWRLMQAASPEASIVAG